MMDKSKSILIAGGTGLIGTRLTELLTSAGYRVRHLSRNRKGDDVVETFTWDIDKNTIEPDALQNVSAIVNLAGAGVADKRWTDKRKKEIVDSRTRSTALLLQAVKKHQHEVRTFICASGTGYYGNGPATKIFTEEDRPGNDFLADVTKVWEAEADKFSQAGVRVAKMRFGVVLSEKDGALPPILKAINLFVGAPLGSGEQVMSWIHIDDACRIIIQTINDDSMSGPYNVVAPNPVTNRELTLSAARFLKKPIIAPKVPAFVLKLLFGEMATIILEGANVSSRKIEKTGFKFQFETLEPALIDLIKNLRLKNQ